MYVDKNPDCDTSCIFTAIQSSYEVLIQSAPTDPPTRISEQPNENNNIHPKSAGRKRDQQPSSSSNIQKSDLESQFHSEPHYHSTFHRKSESFSGVRIDFLFDFSKLYICSCI